MGSVKNLKDGAQIALTYRLFVNGWYLRTCLKRVFIDSKVRTYPKHMPSLILIAEEDNKPIACSLVLKNEFQVFVRKPYRRKGIGSEMYRKSMEILDRKKRFTMILGDDRVRSFYEKVKNVK